MTAEHSTGTPGPRWRALLEARFGSGYRYAEVAARLRRPNANAARVAVERAVGRLAKIMNRRKPTAGSVH